MDQIKKIVTDVAAANLPPQSFEDVIPEAAVDSQGHDALRVTIVIGPDVARRLSGDAVLDTLYQTQRRLSEAGEERFPIVGYATREELEDIGDD